MSTAVLCRRNSSLVPKRAPKSPLGQVCRQRRKQKPSRQFRSRQIAFSSSHFLKFYMPRSIFFIFAESFISHHQSSHHSESKESKPIHAPFPSHSFLFLCVPGTHLTQRPLPHHRHNVLLHFLTPFLQICIFPIILGLPPLIPNIPTQYNDNC